MANHKRRAGKKKPGLKWKGWGKGKRGPEGRPIQERRNG